MEESPKNSAKPAVLERWLIRFFVGGLFLLMLACLGASLVPFNTYRARLDAASGDGVAEGFTPAIYNNMRGLLLGFAAVGGAGGFALLKRSHQLAVRLHQERVCLLQEFQS